MQVMGDVHVTCKSGKISVDKIKGENLVFDCGKGVYIPMCVL